MDLDKMKEAQKLSYDCAITIGKELREGWTEKQTAKLMDTYLKDHGVKNFFHSSFAWFSERTAFEGIKTYIGFLPSNRTYTSDMVVILDTAPIINDYIADIGFTFSKVKNEELIKARELLIEFRNDILLGFQNKLASAEIWKQVDLKLKDQGYENAYEKYPFSVLGHKVGKAKLNKWRSFTAPFGIQAYASILAGGIRSSLLGPHNDTNPIGAWAIEPHIGQKTFGAKFEEMLIVKENEVFWLDDDVPHLNLPKGFF